MKIPLLAHYLGNNPFHIFREVFNKFNKWLKYKIKHFCSCLLLVTQQYPDANKWVMNNGNYQLNNMMKRTVIAPVLLSLFVLVFLVAPVAAAGLTITNGNPITRTDGSTSPVIIIDGEQIDINGTITIDVSGLNWYVSTYPFSTENVVIHDNAVAATWTSAVAGNDTGTFLTLTSTGGNTSAGENITVTFTGAVNPWVDNPSGSDWEIPLTATRTDTGQTGDFTIVIISPPPSGLSIADGVPITATDGSTSPVITITDSPIAQNGTINISVANLHQYVVGYTFTTANVVVTSFPDAEKWTAAVNGNILTLTSSSGSADIGETVTVTFTGSAGKPWFSDMANTVTLTAKRTDGEGQDYFDFGINTPPPTPLIITEGAKITTTNGATSPVITITGSNITRNGTIVIDVSGLTGFVSGGFTNANVVIQDTAVAANWTRTITGDSSGTYLTLTSAGGPTTAGENVTVTFTGATHPWTANTGGEKTISLYTTRTDGAGEGTVNLVIETTPPHGFLVVANFTASPTADIAPLTVAFTDTSLGHPTSWSWDFGDGSNSTSRDPSHTYPDVGTYTVSLNATNAYGSDTKTQDITVINGAIREAHTTIAGLTITNYEGRQTVTVDTSVLPAALIPNNSVLELQPPAESGFASITIFAKNGFSQNGTLIVGKPSGVRLVTEEIAPSSGFSTAIGKNASFNYSIELPSWPCNAKLSTKIWEGVIPRYDNLFHRIASKNGAFPLGTAYTAKVTSTNFPPDARVQLHMSVNTIAFNEFLGDATGRMFIWRIADDEKSGQILPTSHRYSDPVNNLDYYEADSPLGLSTFGISSLTGNNNPFQLITFVIVNVISQLNNPGSPAVVQTTLAPVINQTTLPDPGTTAKIYSNADGVITQATKLLSTDGLANVFLDPGIVAKNSSGMPLTSIGIRRIPAGELPAASPGAGLSFTGMAYDLQPDGGTFSPSTPISFTILQAQWGQEYIIQEYDTVTRTWQAHPGSYNPETGTITVQVSHLCTFALFARSTEIPKAATPEPTIIVSSKSSMSTNVGMYSWIISSVVQNPVIIVIVLAALALVAYFGWWKRRL